MMELTCAFILILASLVSATPYGYGVKGGASARAVSSASAGAFGGVGEVPLTVPLGAGYSGSFSKSSSSSSASSSASSSSSSSSFSYSGSGAGGLSVSVLNGEVQGNSGCSSGNCQNAGTLGVPTQNQFSLQGYNAANSAAKAGAGLSELGCQEGSCDNNSEKCKSGQCKPGSQTSPNISTDSDSKCESGQCASNLQSGASPTEYGPNDIRVLPESSGRAHDSKDQSHDYGKTSSAYNAAGADCSGGKCGPSGAPKSNYGHNSENSYQSSSASDKQQSSNLNAGITSHYHTPATHLETPKLGSNCNSGNCQAEPGHETSPSSYNVPIHGAYDSGEKKPTCDGVKCENQPKGTYSPTNSNSLSTNYLSPQHSLSIDNSVTKGPFALNNPSVSNCRGSNCNSLPSSQVPDGPTYTAGPGHVNFGNSPTNAPGLTNCRTPNCSPIPPYPGLTAGSNTAPGHTGYTKQSEGIKPSNDKLPAYTGGFGGPAGLLNPNEYDATVTTGHPSHVHSNPSQNGVPSGTSPVGCNSPSCSGYPSGSGANAQSGTYGQKPGVGVNIPSEKLPTYTGGFGGPSGMLKPNDIGAPASATAVPNYSHPASSTYNTQPQGTIGCKTPNCGGYSPTAAAGATAQPEYFGSQKPSISISSPSQKQPPYTGGFGGPGGVFKPNEYDSHATGPSGPSYNPSGSYNTPASGGCKSQNCFSSTAAANAQAESFGVTKPSSGQHFSSITSPGHYTGNYDVPSGVNRPNEISTPASVPHFTYNQSPSSPGSYSTGCKTADCALPPTHGASPNNNVQPGYFGTTKPQTDRNPSGSTSPQYTGSFSVPSGTSKPYEHTHITPAGSVSSNCKTPNCVSPSTSSGGAISGANTQSGSYASTKPSSDINLSNDKLPSYSGGFGGASGILKPNEHKDSAVSPTLNDYNNPIGAPAGESKPVACTSGNCNPHILHGSAAHSHNDASNGAHATASAAAEANAVEYTGGFGGPPGVLLPYDDGKIGAIPTAGRHAPASQIGAHSPNANGQSPHQTIPGANSGTIGPAGLTGAHGNTGLQAGSIAGSSAYAGAAAGASGVLGHNTPGSHYDQTENVNGGSPCGGSCGGGYNGGSSLDLNGGHGLAKPAYSGGLNGGRSTAGASAKSLTGAGAFGLGGSFASSSASAHASAGAYTKGGYGKR